MSLVVLLILVWSAHTTGGNSLSNFCPWPLSPQTFWPSFPIEVVRSLARPTHSSVDVLLMMADGEYKNLRNTSQTLLP
jgi:hypothetical protein